MLDPVPDCWNHSVRAVRGGVRRFHHRSAESALGLPLLPSRCTLEVVVEFTDLGRVDLVYLSRSRVP